MRAKLFFTLFFIFSCSSTTHEVPTPLFSKKQLWDKGAMVSAANPHAVDAAVDILNMGGSAVDAAIAAHAVLGLVEPQSSGLGGGGFMLIYDKEKNKVETIDYRSAAPKSAKSEMFVDGKNVVRFGHLVNAVPGSVAGLIKAHEEHGKLSLSEIMKPSIRLAKNGIPVTKDLNYALEWSKESLLENSISRKKFYDKTDNPIAVSDLFKQPKLAKTLFHE